MSANRRKLLNLAAMGLAALLSSPSLAATASQAGTPAQAAFSWDSTGRRDPFIFREALVEPVSDTDSRVFIPTIGDPIPDLPEPGPGDEVRGDDPTSPANRRIARHKAELLAKSAWERLAAQQFVVAEEHVEQALTHVRQAQLNDPMLTERLTRLQATASRLRVRAETERQFRDLRIVINGIVWQPVNPVALINGELARVGDVVEGAQIREILPDQVIFELKGVRVRKTP